LLLGTDKEGMTAWHCPTKRGNLEIILKLCFGAKKKLTSKEIIYY